MESLKLKVFEVIGSQITIEDFEQWLYNDTEALSMLSSNKLAFEVININYKEKDALESLRKIVSDKFSEEEILLLNTISHCKKIIAHETKDLVFKEVINLKTYFDFDNHYNLLWSFYILKERIDLVHFGYFKEEDVLQMIKQFAQTIVSKFSKNSSLEQKLKLLHYKDEVNSNTW